MTRCGLTEKRMNDRRFRKTEEAIFRAYYSGDVYISIGAMAKKAGISRSTFYRHHRAVGLIVSDYESYVISRYSRMIKRLASKKNVELKGLFVRTLLFIITNKMLAEMLIKGDGRRLICKMVYVLRPYIEKTAKLTAEHDIIFKVCASEITEIITYWVDSGLKEDNINRIIADLMYLIRTAKARLRQISDN